MSSLFKLYSQVSFLDESTHLLASGGDDGLVGGAVVVPLVAVAVVVVAVAVVAVAIAWPW